MGFSIFANNCRTAQLVIILAMSAPPYQRLFSLTPSFIFCFAIDNCTCAAARPWDSMSTLEKIFWSVYWCAAQDALTFQQLLPLCWQALKTITRLCSTHPKELAFC